MKPVYKLLLVEDNANLSAIIKDYLEYSGFEVIACDNGKDAEKMFYKQRFDLLLLDIMIPHKNGLTLAEDIRKRDPNTPIIFLSARSLHEDRIKGFKAGADDYITKPFNAEELILRINSILKRCKRNSPLTITRPQGLKYQIGKYSFDPIKRILSLENGSERILTGKESALLEMLCNDMDEVVMRDEALMTIWGENNYFVGRSMDVFITKLRKYLGDDPNIKINNLHGAGFKLEISKSKA